MADSGIIIPSDISKVINERVNIWQSFDNSQNKFNEMEKFASQVVSSTPAQIPSELTSDNTPPSEVFATSQNFHEELKKIAEATKRVQLHEEEISKLEAARTTAIIIVVIIIVTIILLVVTAMLQ